MHQVLDQNLQDPQDLQHIQEISACSDKVLGFPCRLDVYNEHALDKLEERVISKPAWK